VYAGFIDEHLYVYHRGIDCHIKLLEAAIGRGNQARG
jgi:predicted amidohydrolase